MHVCAQPTPRAPGGRASAACARHRGVVPPTVRGPVLARSSCSFICHVDGILSFSLILHSSSLIVYLPIIIIIIIIEIIFVFFFFLPCTTCRLRAACVRRAAASPEPELPMVVRAAAPPRCPGCLRVCEPPCVAARPSPGCGRTADETWKKRPVRVPGYSGPLSEGRTSSKNRLTF